jgi:hypothetical protein
MEEERLASPSQPAPVWELVVCLLLGLVVLAGSQVPAVWGFWAQRRGLHPDLVFNGAPPTYTDEAATYWSWMRQARDGHFFLTDLYTPEDHPRNYVNLLWWSLGSVCRLTGWSLVAVYSGARVLLGAALMVLLFRLAKRLFPRPGERLACFLVLLLAGGWEGFFRFLGPLPGVPRLGSPAWWMPEISTFFSLMLFPHFLAGFVCMVAVTLALIRGWSPEPLPAARRVRSSVGAGLGLALLTFFHPYDAVSLMGALWTAPLLFGLRDRRWSFQEWKQPLITSAVWLPSFLYNFAVFTANPAMRAWDQQNLMPTPVPKRLIICLGAGLLLSFLALLLPRRLSRAHLVMAAWLLSTLVIIHLPLRFQRRMMGGIQFPLAALGVAGVACVVVPLLQALIRFGGRRAEIPDTAGGICLALVALMTPAWCATPVYLLRDEWANVRSAVYPAWLLQEEVAALRFLEARGVPDSRVLASYEMGNWVPPYTGLRCVLGHYALSIDSEGKKRDIEKFFSAGAEADAWRREALGRWKVSYILSTPHERALGAFNPSTRPWLREVFAAGNDPARAVRVYESHPPPVTTLGLTAVSVPYPLSIPSL